MFVLAGIVFVVLFVLTFIVVFSLLVLAHAVRDGHKRRLRQKQRDREVDQQHEPIKVDYEVLC